MARYEFIACYIMASRRNGTLYTGVTSDLFARGHDHRLRKGSEFAAKYACTLLVWFERFGDVPAAIAREKQIKAWRRDWKLALIERENPEWRDLYDDFLRPPAPSLPPGWRVPEE